MGSMPGCSWGRGRLPAVFLPLGLLPTPVSHPGLPARSGATSAPYPAWARAAAAYTEQYRPTWVCPLPGAECSADSRVPRPGLAQDGAPLHPNCLGSPSLGLTNSPAVAGLQVQLVGRVWVVDRAWSLAGWLWVSHLPGPVSS